MFKYYFKIARRNLSKNKGYTLLNITGLATGMTIAMIFGLWIYDELSFDRYHENYNRIAVVMRHTTYKGKKETGGQSSPIALGVELQSSFGSYFKHVVLSTKNVNYIIANEKIKLTQSGRFMQPDALEMFTLNMLQGSGKGLKNMNSILLSESLARKLFGEENPIDKDIKIDTRIIVKVIGVYSDFPHNSEFNNVFFIAPFDLYASFNQWVKKVQNNWNDNSFPIYVELDHQFTFEQVSTKTRDAMLPHLDAERAAYKPEIFLHPMNKWHLYSKFENGEIVISDQMKLLLFYGVIGVFILFLACINFINLSTIRSEKSAREIGIRKTFGSLRNQIIDQFMIESLLVVALAFILALVLMRFILPWFNGIAEKEINILWTHPGFWTFGITVTLITSLLAGGYTAFYLSSLDPIKVLKGTFVGGRRLGISRKALIVFQFSISITLIIGTIIVYQQILFAKTRPVGYDSDGLIRFPKYTALKGKSDVLRSELLLTGVVIDVAECSSSLTSMGSNNTGFEWKDKDPAIESDFGTLDISYEFGKTIGWQIIDGRDFSRDFLTDSSGIIVNEAAVELTGLKNPVGEIIHSNYLHKGRNFKILGVIRDVMMESPFSHTRPALFFLGEGKWIFVKLNTGINTKEALPKIETVFRNLAPDIPFEYAFIDNEYAFKFASEERIGKFAGFFAILAIIISCLGMFGLSYFVAEQRTKEIGLRKVLGASGISLLRLLSVDFILPVFLSCLIAIPVANYLLKIWLVKYYYHIVISWWIFTVTVMGTLTITFLTVGFQILKAVRTNPVESIRSQ